MARLFPYMHIHDFLSDELNAEILAYAVKRQLDFKQSVIYSGGIKKISESRISLTLKNFEPYKTIIQESIRKRVPALVDGLKLSKFNAGEIETEFVSYGDRSLFKSHIDTAVHKKTEKPRVISVVYYLHSIPKKFEGGNLRIHTISIGEEKEHSIDISPDNNSLLAFPSFAPHEVRPVIAPGIDFKDRRFAINCWILKA
ncbi:2OG-Fe(II) oxygenase [Dyadobacter subterraneus]|uniref:2OG-Fe(II) oxygenase n=1 Tax=Dyadobacter subterraneus TaxID=2773304 RepID=A0ABR9W6E7_9BACT|nr:2OG-Fe(II) oxygenase [Dyadobacter subterraneus]MBE9461047.1 2OG-Fe(II) oxygenase [Dyadobacter subterraneus]